MSLFTVISYHVQNLLNYVISAILNYYYLIVFSDKALDIFITEFYKILPKIVKKRRFLDFTRCNYNFCLIYI
ncbi:hypothetical protein BpHYR1_004894 [Brachionus plicatilis]|uniref:Uncharacterized protein n=1 Tax=Brachionus plicatilis TaxID=10195 RepID=A0A3M7RQI7_BRAPC|nr:hypothetical protein BpHYR1_004894 [Brachionus plicatilis]